MPELFSDYPDAPRWDQEQVRQRFGMFNAKTLRIDQVVFLGPDRAISSLLLKPEHFRDRFTNNLSMDIGDSDGLVFDVSDELTQGHFADTYSPDHPIRVARAVDLIQAGVEALQFMTEESGRINRLTRINGPVSLKRALNKGDRGTIRMEDYSLETNISIWNGDNLAMEMGGVVLKSSEDVAVNGVTTKERENVKTELLEGTAQASIASIFNGLEEGAQNNRTPIVLYDGLAGPIEFLEDVFPGQTVRFQVDRIPSEDRRLIQANFTATVEDRVVMRAFGASCRVRTMEAMVRASGLR